MAVRKVTSLELNVDDSGGSVNVLSLRRARVSDAREVIVQMSFDDGGDEPRTLECTLADLLEATRLLNADEPVGG